MIEKAQAEPNKAHVKNEKVQEKGHSSEEWRFVF
jgi:hypothetical protein